MSVSKTVSFPLVFMTSVNDVAEQMDCDFSTALLRLGRLGLSMYRDQTREVLQKDQAMKEAISNMGKEVNKGG